MSLSYDGDVLMGTASRKHSIGDTLGYSGGFGATGGMSLGIVPELGSFDGENDDASVGMGSPREDGKAQARAQAQAHQGKQAQVQAQGRFSPRPEMAQSPELGQDMLQHLAQAAARRQTPTQLTGLSSLTETETDASVGAAGPGAGSAAEAGAAQRTGAVLEDSGDIEVGMSADMSILGLPNESIGERKAEGETRTGTGTGLGQSTDLSRDSGSSGSSGGSGGADGLSEIQQLDEQLRRRNAAREEQDPGPSIATATAATATTTAPISTPGPVAQFSEGRADVEAVEVGQALDVLVSAIQLDAGAVPNRTSSSSSSSSSSQVEICVQFLGALSQPSGAIGLPTPSGSGTPTATRRSLLPVNLAAHMLMNRKASLALAEEIGDKGEELALQVLLYDVSSPTRNLLGVATVPLWVMIEESCNILRQEVEFVRVSPWTGAEPSMEGWRQGGDDLDEGNEGNEGNGDVSIGNAVVDVRGYILLERCV
jgi:hypothetical protein